MFRTQSRRYQRSVADVYGLVAPLGNCGEVGVSGLTLGGGYGPLNGQYGLAAANLLGAEVVLADGRRVTTGPDDEPALYWAIRGGGGNFSVAKDPASPVRKFLPVFCRTGSAQFTEDARKVLLVLEPARYRHIQHAHLCGTQHLLGAVYPAVQYKLVRALAR